MRKIYCISGHGTAWQYPENLKRNNVEEILCLRVLDGLYYCPDLKVVFKRNCEPEEAGKYRNQYSWDYATFPYADSAFEDIKKNPLWKMSICRIDSPKQEPISDEEALEIL